MHVLFVVCHVLSALAFKVDCPFGGQSVAWDQRGCCCLLFLTPLIFLLQKIAIMHWFALKSYNRPFELLHSWDFGCRGQWLGYRTPFAKGGCLQWLCGISSLIQCAGNGSCRVYGVFSLASASVDGCYLYIIIHYGRSQRDWGIRLVPRAGRPDPEFKAIDTYT